MFGPIPSHGGMGQRHQTIIAAVEILFMRKRKFDGAQTRRQGRKRPSRRVRLVELTGALLLDRRILPAVTALFSAGELRVTGDDQDNVITISRDVGGTIFVNDGTVPIL